MKYLLSEFCDGFLYPIGKDGSLSGIWTFHEPVPGSTGKNRLKYKNAGFSNMNGYIFMKISKK